MIDGVGPKTLPRTPSLLTSGPLRRTTVGVVLLVTIFAFENMAVTTAMPSAVGSLHALAYFGWPFTANLLAILVGTVVAGRLADRHGPAPAVFIGMALFVAGLLIAGSATTILQLVLGRAVQGLGAGLVSVALYVIVAAAYPEALRPKAFAAMSAAWVVPSTGQGTLAATATAGLTTLPVALGVLFGLMGVLAGVGAVLAPRVRVGELS